MNLKKIFTGLVLIGLILTLIPSTAQAGSEKFYFIELYDAYRFDQKGIFNKEFEGQRLQAIYISARSVKLNLKENRLTLRNGHISVCPKGRIQSTELDFKIFELELTPYWKTLEITVMFPYKRLAKQELYQYSPETGKFRLLKIEISKENDEGTFEVVATKVFKEK